MEKSPKLQDCIGEDGYPDLESYVIFKKRRDELLEENELPNQFHQRKRPFVTEITKDTILMTALSQIGIADTSDSLIIH